MDKSNRAHINVCHFTSVHKWDDIRIFLKECSSIADAGFNVSLVAKGVTDQEVNGVKVFGVPDLGGSRLKRATQQGKLVYQKALSLNADIYHFHDPELLRYGKKLARKGKKVVYDSHEDFPGQLRGKHWIPSILRGTVSGIANNYEKKAVRSFAGVVAATPTIRKIFEAHHKNVAEVNNFPILSEFQEGIQEKEPNTLCYVGAITRLRGIVPLIKAMEDIDATLHIAGKFGESDLEHELNQMPGWKKVVFHGILGRKEVIALLHRCQIGTVTLKYNENYALSQPIKMYEYMLAEQAVVATEFPLWKELIDHGKFGACVDPEDPGAIAAAINRLLKDPAMIAEMGRNGKQLVLKKYSWEREAETLIEFYDRISEE